MQLPPSADQATAFHLAATRLAVIHHPTPPIPTATPLDTPLNGGLHASHVIQLAGAPAVGKTQLACAAAASVLRARATVLWLDTSCPHAVRARIRAVLAAGGAAGTDELMRGLVVVPTPTLDAMLCALRALRHDCVAVDAVRLGGAVSEGEAALTDVLRRLRLVVSDSAAAVLSPVLGLRAGGWSGHVAVNEVAVGLRWLAAHKSATVLVVNRVVRDGGGGWKGGLGNYWAAFVDSSVMVQEWMGRVQVMMVVCKKGGGGTGIGEIWEGGVRNLCAADME